TRIEFSLKEAGHVNLSIYDVLGQEVMKVVDKSMKAGQHWLTIKAQNLSSGIYFYKLSVNDFTAIKKMMLLK
ncbi:MAG: T9SS type A sorting domain-containing protein, partial [Calditrichia bacterium]